jgi:hypothetical protein
MMREINGLHRAAAWSVLPDRYAALRQSLISIRSANPDLLPEHQAVLQGTVTHLSEMERKVDRALIGNTVPAAIPKMNEILSQQMDKLTEVHSAIRQSARGDNHV